MADYKPSRRARAEGKPVPSKRPGSGGSIENPDFEQAVWDTVNELADLLLSKHKDYGPRNI